MYEGVGGRKPHCCQHLLEQQDPLALHYLLYLWVHRLVKVCLLLGKLAGTLRPEVEGPAALADDVLGGARHTEEDAIEERCWTVVFFKRVTQLKSSLGEGGGVAVDTDGDCAIDVRLVQDKVRHGLDQSITVTRCIHRAVAQEPLAQELRQVSDERGRRPKMAVETSDARLDVRRATNLERNFPFGCAQIPAASASVFAPDVHIIGPKIANLVYAPAGRKTTRRRRRRR